MVSLALTRFEKAFPANLKGKRLGAVLHPASVLPDLHYTLDLLKEYDAFNLCQRWQVTKCFLHYFRTGNKQTDI